MGGADHHGRGRSSWKVQIIMGGADHHGRCRSSWEVQIIKVGAHYQGVGLVRSLQDGPIFNIRLQFHCQAAMQEPRSASGVEKNSSTIVVHHGTWGGGEWPGTLSFLIDCSRGLLALPSEPPLSQRPWIALGWPLYGPWIALGWPLDCPWMALGWPSTA